MKKFFLAASNKQASQIFGITHIRVFPQGKPQWKDMAREFRTMIRKSLKFWIIDSEVGKERNKDKRESELKRRN